MSNLRLMGSLMCEHCRGAECDLDNPLCLARPPIPPIQQIRDLQSAKLRQQLPVVVPGDEARWRHEVEKAIEDFLAVPTSENQMAINRATHAYQSAWMLARTK